MGFDVNYNNHNDFPMKTRINSDTTVNNYGELLINFCKVTNLKIVNGRMGYDSDKGDMTFSGPAGSSTIDYCIATPDFFPYIKDFQVDVPDQSLSDFHSPIILTLNKKPNIVYEEEITTESDIQYEKINSKWCENKKAEFQSNFDQNKINELRQLLATFQTNGTNQTELDATVKEISSLSTTSGLNTGISKLANIAKTNKQTKKV